MKYAGCLLIGLVWLGFVAAPAWGDAPDATMKPFTFVQVCDPQLGFGGYEHDKEAFRQAVRQINALKPDFVVICGDLVNNWGDQSTADFLEIKRGFTMPSYCVMGNHDAGAPPTATTLKRYRAAFGKDYYAIEHKGYTFVFASTELWRTEVEGESAPHDTWFRQTLRAAHARNRPIFVVQHHSVYLKTPDEADGYWTLPQAKRSELLDQYAECGVVAVLCGHLHQTRLNTYQGIALVTGGAVSKNLDKSPVGFRLWHVDSPTSIRNEFVPLTAPGAITAQGEKPPGVVINYIPSETKIYVGSPGIAVLPNGHYLAKHDEFGPKSTENTIAVSPVFRSVDRGLSWERVATVRGMYWASIFVHQGEAYLIGTSKQHGYVVISRSRDEGVTWTVPEDKSSGLLIDDGKYHCAPVPVVVHQGRIWRAMEDAMGPGGWGSHFRAFMMSVPVDSDLLDAKNWVSSNHIGRDPQWLGGEFRGWLEGNAVVTPEGRVVDMLRVDYRAGSEKAAIIEISDDGKTATFDPATGFVDFPGGAKKFTIRFDPVTKMYWTLSNPILPRHKDPDPGRVRNAVAVMRSTDLRQWEMRCIVLYHPDVSKHGFQYLDWLFEGDDMIVASRTAWGEGAVAAPRQHDANYLTFHRLKNFRALTMEDSAPGAEEKTNSKSQAPNHKQISNSKSQ